MNGWKGLIIRVNLNQGKITKESLNKELVYKFAGGTGINSKILFDEVEPDVDPLGSDNKVIVGTGPCNGTLVPGSQRITVTAKSPLTGIWGDSNSGGSIGAQLKYAGYDHVIIEGKSKEPIYLWIDDDTVEIKSAIHLWGKTTRETRRLIEKEVGDPDISVIAIGPAGENLVKLANIICDLGRALGRAGMGAVFGSKNLKAVAVRGTGGVRVADFGMLEDALRQTYDGWRTHMSIWEARARYGPSARWNDIYAKLQMLPTKNFQQGSFWANLQDPLEHYFVKQKACFSCPVPCDHLTVVTQGPYAGTFLDGVELSTLGDWGARVGADDLDLIFKAAALCDEYGLDAFDMAALVAYVMECFEKGILTREDTGAIQATWGNADAILSLIEMTANRKGLGEILAEGLRGASEVIGRGSERYALNIKNMAPVMREPRASKGWALMYAVSARGSCHVRAHLPEGEPDHNWDSMLTDILKKYTEPLNPLSEEAKGELTKWHEDLTAFKSSMELCHFSLYPWMHSENSAAKLMVQFYNSVTGLDLNVNDALRIGERIVNIQKAFNVMVGLTREDDSLPERFTKEPMPDGIGKGQTVKLEPMLDEYYKYRGWDKGTGFPTKTKLLELGLDDVIDKLDSAGKLRV